ncbi:carotenoid cleavage dioxygenase 1 [Thozetella sp. PMI_491]|nr:carotenoid cleavage dioxygenase 1 [Thozetella sp. PMI_491]
MNAADPIRRGAAHEQTDEDALVRNLVSGSYQEWPNDAGFDGLSQETTQIETVVTGTIPAWAAGVLYRTGPGVCKIADTVKGTFYATHWFDGLAQTHRFELVEDTDGACCRVLYSSRRQCEAMIQHIKRNGERKGTSFGQRRDPCIGLFGKFMSVWEVASPPEENKNIENVCVVVEDSLPGFDECQVLPVNTGSLKIDPVKADQHTGSGGHRTEKSRDMWLLTDTSTVQKIDAETLEPIGYAKQHMLHPDLKGHVSSAHAQRDPVTGDVFNFNLDFGRVATYRVFAVRKATGKTEILATIQHPDTKAAYIHSFYLSPSFVVLCVPSTHLGLNGMKILWERNVMDAMEPFDPKNKCKWFVVDRLHGRGVVAEYETDAGFFFHTINSFEELDEVDREEGTLSLFCDAVTYGSHDVLFSLYYDVLLQRKQAAQRLWEDEERARNCVGRFTRRRFRVPIRRNGDEAGGEESRSSEKTSAAITATTVEQMVSIPGPHAGELPTINPLFATKRQRYVYGLPTRGLSTLTDTLVKTDLTTREAIYWNNEQGHTPGEAVFIPRPGGMEEDDGVLLSVVLDGANRTSYLVCLDAATMKELGRAEVGCAVGLGFHGTHVSSL